MKTLRKVVSSWSSDSGSAESGFWKSTMAIASSALEGTGRMQQAVSQSLKLQQKIRTMREELHKAEAERDIYRDLHARTLEELQHAMDTSPAEWKRLRAETEALQIRRRAYKLLVEHYARIGAPIDQAIFSAQRRRVQQHFQLQRRKGLPITQVSVDDIAFLLR
ncbi:hypothetical protein UB46_20760 [Burkholderiaceae bacterium 16]|uniref:hypothetical protein n=2 Tax=Burkholderiaceae TaxID=119060 RepID=UPI00044929C7|nr:hypothetical protein CF70_007765 [Cupriavidus sp. SK-3]KJK22566.1 hypothetical protein UB46_20760 [Burkholderiaceae bacterium 16]